MEWIRCEPCRKDVRNCQQNLEIHKSCPSHTRYAELSSKELLEQWNVGWAPDGRAFFATHAMCRSAAASRRLRSILLTATCPVQSRKVSAKCRPFARSESLMLLPGISWTVAEGCRTRERGGSWSAVLRQQGSPHAMSEGCAEQPRQYSAPQQQLRSVTRGLS